MNAFKSAGNIKAALGKGLMPDRLSGRHHQKASSPLPAPKYAMGHSLPKPIQTLLAG